MDESEGERVRWVGDLGLVLGQLVGLAALVLAVPFASYLEGLRLWSGVAPLVFAILLPLVFFVLLLVRAATAWRCSGPIGRAMRLAFLAAVVLFFVPFGQTSVYRAVRSEVGDGRVSTWAFLYASRTWVRCWADIPAMRAWATANPGWRDERVGSEVLETRRPGCIRTMKPYRVRVWEDGSGVTLVWDNTCSFLDRGSVLVLYVGPEGDPAPPPEVAALVVAPGVVVWPAKRWDVLELR